ncbi:MAG TPA: DUF368 domain-containing protein [Planctomycetaceae bacterium]|nr:DUF368 domain-containing protein [Planctomycetaceae bacterium]
MSAKDGTFTADLLQVARGFLMGGADIIPGVSGGTVALILGIYERLVRAISRVDGTLFSFVRHGEWKQAAHYFDLRFLITLGIGIGLGIISLAGLMHVLLLEQRTFTLAAFYGLIAASSWLVACMVDRWRFLEWICLIAGGLFAFWLVGLPILHTPPDNSAYLFFCGAVAICAMILPGISGAFILLLLGKYVEITGLIKGLLHGEISISILITISVFALGCLTGLLTFSKLLKWLLTHYFSVTMAMLCGFMIGSLRKLFPFQNDLTPEITELKHKIYVNRNFAEIDLQTELIPTVVIAILAAAFVLVLSRLSEAKPHPETIENDEE